jgi:hypothetical protein
LPLAKGDATAENKLQAERERSARLEEVNEGGDVLRRDIAVLEVEGADAVGGRVLRE